MQCMSMILPSFLSVCFSEHLKTKELTLFQFIKKLAIYIILNNLLAIMICYIIFKVNIPLSECFKSNLFFIKYTILNLTISILLPIIFIILSPYLHISLECIEKLKTGCENERI
jgi:hypothetical protein